MAGGWFPRFSPDGSKVTSERVGFWQAQWLDNDKEIGHNGFKLVIDGAITAFDSLNALTAGGGKWAGDKGGPGIYRSWGAFIPGAGNAALSPSGRFAYKEDRQSDNSALILDGVGPIAHGPISDVRISDTLLVWSEGPTNSYGYTDKGLDLRIPGLKTYRPIPIDTPEGPWVLNHTDTGIILRPISEPLKGYRFDNGGKTFYPDGVYVNGNIKVGWTDGDGNYASMNFPLSIPRLVLGIPPKIDPPVVIPPVVIPPKVEEPKMAEYPFDFNPTGRLQALRDGFPTPLGGRHAEYLVKACKTVGFGAGLLEKPGGNNITLPNGVKVSSDWMVFPNGSGTDFIGDSEDKATIGWGSAQDNPGKLVDVSGLFLDDVPPVEPPDVDPPKDDSEAIKALTDMLNEFEQSMTGLISGLDKRVEKLEKEKSPTTPPVVTGSTFPTAEEIAAKILAALKGKILLA